MWIDDSACARWNGAIFLFLARSRSSYVHLFLSLGAVCLHDLILIDFNIDPTTHIGMNPACGRPLLEDASFVSPPNSTYPYVLRSFAPQSVPPTPYTSAITSTRGPRAHHFLV